MARNWQFMTTIWDEIKKARENSPTSVNSFAKKYHRPILMYIKCKGFSDPDAEDLAQEVFLVIFKESVLQKADSSKGRLRNLLLAVTENVVKRQRDKSSALKRGSGEGVVSLDQDDYNLEEIISFKCGDVEFDRIWLRHIIALSFERLRDESDTADKPYFKTLELFLSQNITYGQLAKRLGIDLQDAKNYIHRAKEKLLNYIDDEVASYCSSREEYEEELKEFLKYFELLK